MSSRIRPLRWLLPLAILTALALASTAGANHLGSFELGHSEFENATGAEPNGLSCQYEDPCLRVVNDTSSNPVQYSSASAIEGYSPTWFGVSGQTSAQVGEAAAVRGLAYNADGTAAGVFGSTFSDDANAVGVLGEIQVDLPGAGSKAVYGNNLGAGANGFGVVGEQHGGGIGVLGSAVTGIGVAGTTTDQNGIGIVGYRPNGLAGLFVGNVYVAGTLAKSAGAFRIDHPLDPAHKYLQHSFVESPDMKNVYDGVVRTDRRGFATVRLPRYFQALNRSFRYQLTIVGSRGWRARVVKEIAGSRFTLQSDEPNVKVSWQVTGIRKDRYANAHRIQPETSKPASEQGTYLAPELYGKPAAAAAFRLPRNVAAARVAPAGEERP